MTENNAPAEGEPTKLSQIAPVRTAGALPSSRTSSLMTEALQSDDLDVVKSALVHTWLHYQSLEFELNDFAGNLEAVQKVWDNASADGLEQDVDFSTFLVRAFSGALVLSAYDNAHEASFFMQVLGMDPETALRFLYAGLDYSDAEREAAEEAAVDAEAKGVVEEAEAILRTAVTVPDVVADEDAHPEADEHGEPGSEPTS